jgi:hypothetical protein
MIPALVARRVNELSAELIQERPRPLRRIRGNCGRLRGGGVHRFCLPRQNRPQAGSTTLILPLSSEDGPEF